MRVTLTQIYTQRMENANPNFKTPENIRAKLLMRGLTVASFARKHGFRPSTAYAAARGDRLGIVGTKIRLQLQEELR